MNKPDMILTDGMWEGEGGRPESEDRRSVGTGAGVAILFRGNT